MWNRQAWFTRRYVRGPRKGGIVPDRANGADTISAGLRLLASNAFYRREDAFQEAIALEERAAILGRVGNMSAALAEVEGLLARPSHLNARTRRLDPRWDPIRNDPRVHMLLVKYAAPGAGMLR